MIDDYCIEFNEKSSHINVYVFSDGSYQEDFVTAFLGDFPKLGVSATIILIYCLSLMGSFSPIHFRSVAGTLTLFCVALSYFGS
jgi:hypothetical protein